SSAARVFEGRPSNRGIWGSAIDGRRRLYRARAAVSAETSASAGGAEEAAMLRLRVATHARRHASGGRHLALGRERPVDEAVVLPAGRLRLLEDHGARSRRRRRIALAVGARRVRIEVVALAERIGPTRGAWMVCRGGARDELGKIALLHDDLAVLRAQR